MALGIALLARSRLVVRMQLALCTMRLKLQQEANLQLEKSQLRTSAAEVRPIAASWCEV